MNIKNSSRKILSSEMEAVESNYYSRIFFVKNLFMGSFEMEF